MAKLTAAKVRTLGKPGMIGDGGGLYLRIAPGGSKQWIQRATIGGKRHEIGLGAYPAVTLAKARDMAQATRAAIAAGRDPLAEKRQARTPTFAEAAAAVAAALLPTWRNEKHGKQFISTLTRYAFPVFGDMPVDRIGREYVLRSLTPIWTTKPETARRVRQRIRTVLRWAQAHDYVEHNAAGEAIDGALPAMPKVKAHQRALPYQDVAAALAKVDETDAWVATKMCFRFAVLTAARSGEARAATWPEIDGTVWTIPGERMKAGKVHRVPLSDEAVTVLHRARALSDYDGLIFPSVTGRMLSDSTVSKLLRETGIDAVPHGFRSSFRDWCAETGKPREIAEAALAHTVGGVEGAYFRSDLFDARRRLMSDWAQFLEGKTGQIVRIYG